MRATIVLVSLLIFLVFGVSGFYSQYCYMQYRSVYGQSVPLLDCLREYARLLSLRATQTTQICRLNVESILSALR
jgi:hypothetical protein